MARNKRSTALFEVIHTAARPPVASPESSIPTPKWWGRGKAVPKPQPPTPREPLPPEPAPPVESAPVFIENPRPLPTPQPDGMPMAQEMRGADQTPLKVDTALREVCLRLSYGGAAAVVFIVVLVLAIAYLAGSRSGSAGVPAESTAVHNQLLAAVAAPPAIAKVSSPAPVQTPPEISPTPPQRHVGLNYVIAQSYPDQATAQRACDALNNAGLPCTVVRGLTQWMPKTWFSVVGLQPFDHILNNPDLENYKSNIEAVGVQFAGHVAFNRFNPSVYCWRAESDQ